MVFALSRSLEIDEIWSDSGRCSSNSLRYTRKALTAAQVINPPSSSSKSLTCHAVPKNLVEKVDLSRRMRSGQEIHKTMMFTIVPQKRVNAAA